MFQQNTGKEFPISKSFSISVLLLEVRRLRISHFSHCIASTEWRHLIWISQIQITWIWPLTFLCFLVWFCHVELDFGGDGLKFVSLCLCVMMVLMLAWISEGFRFRCSEVTCDCRYLYSWELSQATVRKYWWMFFKWYNKEIAKNFQFQDKTLALGTWKLKKKPT